MWSRSTHLVVIGPYDGRLQAAGDAHEPVRVRCTTVARARLGTSGAVSMTSRVRLPGSDRLRRRAAEVIRTVPIDTAPARTRSFAASCRSASRVLNFLTTNTIASASLAMVKAEAEVARAVESMTIMSYLVRHESMS